MLKEDISGFETIDNYMQKHGLTSDEIEKRCLERIKKLKEETPSLADKIENLLEEMISSEKNGDDSDGKR